MVLPILSPLQKEKLMANYAVDIGYGVTGARPLPRQHLPAAWQLDRRLPADPLHIPAIDELRAPGRPRDTFCDLPAGLVLVTGPTGSGKSTTLASIIKGITERHPLHIVTVEDPIEYLFQDNLGVGLPARGRDRHGVVPRGAPQRDAPGPGRDHGRRDARLGDDGRRPSPLPRPVTSSSRPSTRTTRRRRSTGSWTRCPAGQAEPGPAPDRARPQGDRLDAADRADRRQGRIPVIEILVNSPKITKLIEDGRDQGDPRGDGELGHLLQDAVDEPVADRAPRERRDRPTTRRWS